jgi:hypothetical protein
LNNSARDWDAVLKILEESYAKFQKAATSDEDSDKFSLEAVELLTEGFVLFPLLLKLDLAHHMLLPVSSSSQECRSLLERRNLRLPLN